MKIIGAFSLLISAIFLQKVAFQKNGFQINIDIKVLKEYHTIKPIITCVLDVFVKIAQ